MNRRKLLYTAMQIGALIASPRLADAEEARSWQPRSLHDQSNTDDKDGSAAVGVIDKLYVLNGGIAVADDRSMYTPGKWKGEQARLSCNAYLMQRAGRWILWDTGIDDRVASKPEGKILAHGIRGIVVRTIREQLADIGISPADISTVILSHAHFDHIGNAGLFSKATWHIQRREHAAMFGPEPEKYGFDRPLYDVLKQGHVELADGDLDVFGDGSVRIVSTPGHTPGHCSLLIRLKRSGAIVLSGDVAHYRYNLDHLCVPSFNSDPEQSKKSMERIEQVVKEKKAQLWLNHDVVQTATILHAPSFYD